MNAPSMTHVDLNIDMLAHRSIVVTTQPELFKAVLSTRVGQSVSLFSSSADAITALESEDFHAFYADFRQLEDRWTGQRFLRFIRERAEYAHIRFWLMAEQWHPSQEQWAIKCGAAGMLKRTPHILAAHILGEAPVLPIALELELDAIDDVFGRFTSSSRAVHIQAARGAIEGGHIEPTREAYVATLASKFRVPERREGFLKALRTASERQEEPEVTQPGDPWMTELNKVFKRYAGALGGRIIISKALEELESTGNYERSFYVSGLTAGLVNPVQRDSFLSAARNARLIA